MQLLEPRTASEFDQYYRLRWEILRAPWQQPRGSEKAADDAAATHALLLTETGIAIGVCRLHLHSAAEAQIRFMAVHPDYQGRGYGKKLLKYLEEKACLAGAQYLTLQARENAVKFYLSCGYQILEKTHLLFGSIQHYKMRKDLVG